MDLRTHRAQSDGDLTFIDQAVTDDENQSTVTSLPSIVYVTTHGMCYVCFYNIPVSRGRGVYSILGMAETCRPTFQGKTHIKGHVSR